MSCGYKCIIIFTAEYYFKKLFHEAKQEGLTITLRHGKIMFCGPSKAGKTSFSGLLKNKMFNSTYKSTSAGETEQILVSSGKVDVVRTQWKHLDMDLEIERLIQHFVSKLEKKKALKALHTNNQNSNEHSKNLSENLDTNNTNDDSLNLTDSDKSSSDAIAKSSQLTTSIDKDIQIISDIEKAIESIATISLSSSASESVPETWDVLTLLDTGGQPEFISMLPAISTATALTFVVLDLSGGKDCLHKQVLAQHSNSGYKMHNKNYTNRQLLECLLMSVKESATTTPYYPSTINVKGNQYPQPAVCFIGTHADDVIRAGQGITDVTDAINKEIIRSLSNIKVEKVLDVWNYNGKVLVAVDNTTAGKFQNKDSIAENIRRKVFDDIIKKNAQYEIPLTWFVFELQLRRENKVFLTLSEAESVSNKIMPEGYKMEEWQLIEALKFYHSIGILLYFHEKESGMSELVITDPQWLFNNLTRLVTCTFIKDRFVSNTSLTKFANEGIFSTKLLDDIDLDIRDVKKESFLKLLTYLKIVAPIDDNCQQYFMPSILPTSEYNIESKLDHTFGYQRFYKPNTNEYVEVEPLRTQFASGTIPRGFFCFLAVQLLHAKPVRDLYGTNNDEILYRYDNLITFRIGTYHYLTVIDRITYLELQVRIKDDKPSPVHYQIQKLVTRSIKIVCEKFGWQYTNLRFGFLCGQCSGYPDHLTYLSLNEPIPNEFPDDADCGRQGTKLEGSHKVWFLVSYRETLPLTGVIKQKAEGYKVVIIL